MPPFDQDTQGNSEEMYYLYAVTKIRPEFSHGMGVYQLCYSHVRPAVFIIHLCCYNETPPIPAHVVDVWIPISAGG